MVGSGQPLLGAYQFAKGSSEMTSEQGVPVRDDHLGYPMELPDMVDKQPGGLLSGCVRGGCHEMAHLGELIYYHVDGVMSAVRTRKLSDEIYGYGVPWCMG